MAVSDTLYEAEEAIRDYQRAGIITSFDDPEVELVVAVMRAVRLMPGRDRWPDAPNTFAADLASALERYDQATVAPLFANKAQP
jgi:hypothetical protein